MGALGFVLVFYIGFYYFRLAENHNKNKWIYGFFGILLFFVCIFLFTVFQRIIQVNEITELSLSLLTLKALFFSIVVVFIVFHIFDFYWNKKNVK